MPRQAAIKNREYMRQSIMAIVIATVMGLVFASSFSAMAIARDIKAGPIWNDADAGKKCPKVCAKAGRTWNGDWHTTVEGQMSVCQCQKSGGGFSGGSNPPQGGGGPGTSCSADGDDVCAGCSVSCPAGKQAMCREGEVHRTDGFSPVCWTKSDCHCE